MEETVIKNNTDFKKIKRNIIQGGYKNLQILADFDRTLTSAFVNGKKTPSIVSVLRDKDYISKEYSEKAKALADKYHPIETDPNLSNSEKKQAMQDWWTKHFDLLIKSGLNKSHIEKIIENGDVEFRPGSLDLIDRLHKFHIPLVILSSAALGVESISGMLKKHEKMYDNIHIISNEYIWDDSGKAIGIKKPVIHVMNKDETAIRNFPQIYKEVKNRKNVILLGDSLGDIEMIKGFDYNNLIKIGFLNEDIEKSLDAYKKAYDVLITNDGSMNFVNKLIREVKE